MHYYQFNIADYRKDTQHLTQIEHYVYRELIDWYYLDEKPIPRETQRVIRRLRLLSENAPSVLNVLEEFFCETEAGWLHNKIEREIAAYKRKADVARANGCKGGRPKLAKKTNVVKLAKPGISASQANYKPVTNNQNKVKKQNKSSMPVGFVVSERVKEWALKKGFGKLDDHLENFKLACSKKGYQYVDWDSAFMSAVRDDWARINQTQLDSKPRAGFPQ